MSLPIIEIDGLGKKYRIGSEREPYLSLRDQIARRFSRNGHGAAGEEFWALRDVGFDVQRGETVGIIGRNGAGKSTLLKILSQITPPTEGKATMRGRVASLLEVGTGFHAELTGRENIFLNGAVLGMTRAEVRSKFDEIVAFAEVDKFLDTPVKRYSSGMYVRLAFAVAAHLEPEILIVDEVLAVGDIGFQKKCLSKMGEVARQGRTVLLVSHNMGAIRSLCQRAVWLNDGRVESTGDAVDVLPGYLSSQAEVNITARQHEAVRIRKVTLRDKYGSPSHVFAPGDDITVEVQYTAPEPAELPNFWVGIYGASGGLFGASMLIDGQRPAVLDGDGTIACTFRSVPLLTQSYTVSIGMRDQFGERFLCETREVAVFHITGRLAEFGLTGERADIIAETSTPVLVPYTWTLPDGVSREVSLRHKTTEAGMELVR